MDIKGMGKLFLKGLLFMALFFILDVAFGFVMSKLADSAFERNPHLYETRNTVDKVETEVVCIGASNVKFAYVTSILEDELNLSVYNCGKDAKTVYYQTTMINSILDRYTPKVILWGLQADFLFATKEEFQEWDAPEIRKCFTNKNCYEILSKYAKKETVKLFLNSYRYNSELYSLIESNTTPRTIYNNGGYEPLNGKMDSNAVRKQFVRTETPILDAVDYFDRTLKRCKEKGILVVGIFSPTYNLPQYHSPAFNTMVETLNKYDYCLIEDFFVNDNLAKPELFRDASHVNDSGAHIFTRMLAQRLKPLVENK